LPASALSLVTIWTTLPLLNTSVPARAWFNQHANNAPAQMMMMIDCPLFMLFLVFIPGLFMCFYHSPIWLSILESQTAGSFLQPFPYLIRMPMPHWRPGGWQRP
jgi:hypothetical protein